MPKLIYHPRRDIPKAIRELKTFSPKEISLWILNRYNKKVTPESITMWLKRHKDVHETLKKEIIAEEKPKEEIQETIFQNGTFEELESVKEWINQMKDRDLDDKVIKNRVWTLKRICRGIFPNWGINLIETGEWSYKHPDRLTLNDSRELIRILKDKGVDTHSVRLTLRDFLTSKGIQVIGISGGKAKGYGKYAKLFVDKQTLDKMLEWIKQQNPEAYYADLFMFKTGTRITATLNIYNVDVKFYFHNGYAEVCVYDKGRRSLNPERTIRGIKREGKEWIKYITDPELIHFFSTKCKSENPTKIFTIEYTEISRLNREAINLFAPEIVKEYGDVDQNHFWRHMFAQHMLRLTDWNYSVVAYLGGWTIQALQESYGMPPEQQIRQWGLSALPKL